MEEQEPKNDACQFIHMPISLSICIPEPPAQSFNALLITEQPIKKIVTPLTMGGKIRFNTLGGKKLTAISNKEHTIAVYRKMLVLNIQVHVVSSYSHVPRTAPQPCRQGRYRVVPSSSISVGQYPEEYI